MAENKKCLIIIGMHRSGTSALSGMLSKSGLDVGENIMDANEYNPKGYYENASITELNDRIFSHLGTNWKEKESIVNKITEEIITTYSTEARQILNQEFESKEILIKDPRISLLLPFWIKVFESEKIEYYPIIVLRNPIEIAHSLFIREGMQLLKSIKIWYNYVYNSEALTRNIARIFVNYTELGTPKFVEKLNSFLKQNGFKNQISTKSTSFIDNSLNHHSLEQSKTSKLVPEVYFKVYYELNKKSPDLSKLNQLYKEVNHSLKLTYRINQQIEILKSIIYLDHGDGFDYDNPIPLDLELLEGDYLVDKRIQITSAKKIRIVLTESNLMVHFNNISINSGDNIQVNIDPLSCLINGNNLGENNYLFVNNYPHIDFTVNIEITGIVFSISCVFDKEMILDKINAELEKEKPMTQRLAFLFKNIIETESKDLKSELANVSSRTNDIKSELVNVSRRTNDIKSELALITNTQTHANHFLENVSLLMDQVLIQNVKQIGLHKTNLSTIDALSHKIGALLSKIEDLKNSNHDFKNILNSHENKNVLLWENNKKLEVDNQLKHAELERTLQSVNELHQQIHNLNETIQRMRLKNRLKRMLTFK